MLIQGAEMLAEGGLIRADVRLRRGVVAEIGARLVPGPGDVCLAAGGGLLLPGLHDHHIHLTAWAASLESVLCGPPSVVDADGLVAALRGAPGTGWLRGVGYHASVAGEIDAGWLDGACPDRPVRIQHRSGQLWVLNHAGLRAIGVPEHPTGRFFHADSWLRRHIAAAAPGLRGVGERLAAFGVTGVTDTSASNNVADWRRLMAAQASGEVPQAMLIMGDASLHGVPGAGALKFHLHEPALPPVAELARAIAGAHAAGRVAAFHCVTEAELVFALAALEAAGPVRCDRIEHAAITPAPLLAWMAALGVCVVTQPHFLAERGDQYLTDLPAYSLEELYRGAGFEQAGVALAGGSDAPYGGADPWASMAAATRRRTPLGRQLAPSERLTPERALDLFLTPLDDPGGTPRRVVAGAPADFCLLDRDWAAARLDLAAVRVRRTWRAGRVIFTSGLDGVDEAPVERGLRGDAAA